MSETTQGYFELESGSGQTNPGFQSTLDYIREAAQSERQKGELFERLMLTYFSEDPDYKQQFSEVYLYKDWAELQAGYDANDIGIDLVAKEREGGFCAIQCKCYAEDTRISKPHLDSFISASAGELFTSRFIVDTGGEWGPNALRTIDPIKDKLRIIRYSDLQSSPFDWPDLSLHDPEQLAYQQRRFHLKDHQKEAFDDVTNGFKASDRGKMIMACGTRQNLHRTQNRRGNRRYRRQSALSRPVHQSPLTGDAGMVGATRNRPQLYRYLFRYSRRTNKRGLLYSRTQAPRYHRPSVYLPHITEPRW